MFGEILDNRKLFQYTIIGGYHEKRQNSKTRKTETSVRTPLHLEKVSSFKEPERGCTPVGYRYQEHRN